jgi:hypothetical protein
MLEKRTSDPESFLDRRAWTRFPCNLSASCSTESSTERSQARILDISQGGLRMLVHRQFEQATWLQVHLPEEQPPLLARVMHARFLGGGVWTVGCRFKTPLTEEEMEALLPAPPEE